MHHDRSEPDPGNGVHDDLVWVKFWVPPRSDRLGPVRREVPDPFIVEIEDDRFE